MQLNWKQATVALALTLTILVGQSKADEVKAPPSPEDVAKAFETAGKPSAEHAKLEPLVGKWNYTCKCWMDPSLPAIETTGTIKRKWILGGRFLQEKVVGTGFDGQPGFEGFGLLGYDNTLKKYVSTFVCNVATGTSNGVGTCEKSGNFTFQSTCSCPLTKQIVHGREEIRFESPDKVVMVSYKIEDGKEVKAMEIVAIRKK